MTFLFTREQAEKQSKKKISVKSKYSQNLEHLAYIIEH